LEALAHTDQLTKIHNRKSCDDILENKCGENTAFSVIMFDIDNFKRINDTYGHVAGDEVLVKIAELALKLIRKDDVLARWGGEEFVIITHGATLKEAEELAKRLKEQLTLIEYHGQKQSITCSFGVTAFLTGDTVTSIIRRADQLLYLAKEYGKNRVVAG
jgi:diguanylate cyclase (GGDEF)-like protein